MIHQLCWPQYSMHVPKTYNMQEVQAFRQTLFNSFHMFVTVKLYYESQDQWYIVFFLNSQYFTPKAESIHIYMYL